MRLSLMAWVQLGSEAWKFARRRAYSWRDSVAYVYADLLFDE
jgi:hypothetical protein